ncbi:hypothetical protein PC120_g26738, partial [Phytophthora cactorum]
FLSFDSYCVIVEIDENQHTAYNSAGENKREQDIIKDIQNTPIVFVRLNPDKYKAKSGKTSVSAQKDAEWNPSRQIRSSASFRCAGEGSGAGS